VKNTNKRGSTEMQEVTCFSVGIKTAGGDRYWCVKRKLGVTIQDSNLLLNAPKPLKTEMPLDVTTHQEALPYSPFTTTTKGFC
jgi:hypothetical protein